MTYYTAPSGATVLSTGSMQWNWGLDESFILKGQKFAHPGAMQITRNVLTRFGALTRPADLLSTPVAGSDTPFDRGYPDNIFVDESEGNN
jgi:hypothetical protein